MPAADYLRVLVPVVYRVWIVVAVYSIRIYDENGYHEEWRDGTSHQKESKREGSRKRLISKYSAWAKHSSLPTDVCGTLDAKKEKRLESLGVKWNKP